MNQDRLNIYDDDRRLIEEIRDTDFLGCKSIANVSNTELFLMCVSIGYEMYIDFTPVKQDGYVLFKYITEDDWTYLYSLCIHHFGDDSILDDKPRMYEYIQKCAHLGIKYLHKQLKENDSNKLKVDLIKSLKNTFEQNKALI